MSLEERRCDILQELFDLVEADTNGEGARTWIWPNDTIEIKIFGRFNHLFLTREGRVLSSKSVAVAEVPCALKREVQWCGEYSACCKGCGCGCLADLGFYPEASSEILKEAKHCQK